MPDREHTSKHYELQLRELKNKLLLMSHKAEQMISDAIRALVERKLSVAEDVIIRDDELDKLEIEVDDLCYAILALEQPVARDLRFIATAMKIVKDIERIGDIALAVVAPPAHHVVRDEIHQRAPRIHQPERYAGQQSKQELHGGEWRAVRAII